MLIGEGLHTSPRSALAPCCRASARCALTLRRSSVLPNTHHPQELLAQLSDPTANLALENHQFGLPPRYYKKHPELDEAFHMLSTTKDR